MFLLSKKNASIHIIQIFLEIKLMYCDKVVFGETNSETSEININQNIINYPL